MPYAPPSHCPTFGCRKLTVGKGRCEDHQPKAWERPSANSRRLSGRDRERFRTAVLTANPHCVMCGRTATEADHVLAIGLGGANDPHHNGQGLCEPCHEWKTKQDMAATRRRRR